MQAAARTQRESISPRVGQIVKYHARINNNIPLVAPCQVVIITFNCVKKTSVYLSSMAYYFYYDIFLITIIIFF